MISFNPDRIILGCTHYPYLMNEFIKYLPKDMFIDPADIFVNYIKNDLAKKNLLNNCVKAGKEEFFVSAKPNEFIKNAEIFYNIEKLPEVISL